MVSTHLQALGFATRELNSGAQLLEEVAACDVSRAPSLVVVDAEMPGMDGLTAVNKLSSLPQADGLRVLLLCPYGTANQVRVSAPNISMAALTKPLRQSLFTRALLLAFPPLATPPSPSPRAHLHQPTPASYTPTAVAAAGAGSAAAVARSHDHSSQHCVSPRPFPVPAASASAPAAANAATTPAAAAVPMAASIPRSSDGGGKGSKTDCGGGDGVDGRAAVCGGGAVAAAAAAACGRGSNVSSGGAVSPRGGAAGAGGGGAGGGGAGGAGGGSAQGRGVGVRAESAVMPRRNSWQNLISVGVANERTTPGGFIVGLADKHPLKILLVEDNLVNQRVATRMLSNMGYSVDLASNGLDAVNALACNTYDLVFMDIQMPVMDGIEATQRIHQLAQQEGRVRPRIVAMTANVLHSDRQQCLSAGMDGFLSKPIRVADLVAVLERTPSASAPPPPPPPPAAAVPAAAASPTVPAAAADTASAVGDSAVAATAGTAGGVGDNSGSERWVKGDASSCPDSNHWPTTSNSTAQLPDGLTKRDQ
ncbi:hypothetical protein CLOP_g22321 [Closterium sp. NIES-67]|nr:hypothetical protein CLOP_g22321 [Closterium sp. NIES-67]